LGDFSENYSFIIQEAAQAFHLNSQQASIHAFVSYFKNSKNELENLYFVSISQCLYHDTVMVYTFQKHLIAFLKENFPHISKTYYFSYGA
jgi:UDP-2,3-diacylglucosamine pyrophosphatase LpxH